MVEIALQTSIIFNSLKNTKLDRRCLPVHGSLFSLLSLLCTLKWNIYEHMKHSCDIFITKIEMQNSEYELFFFSFIRCNLG
jgi:hypothetical protein